MKAIRNPLALLLSVVMVTVLLLSSVQPFSSSAAANVMTSSTSMVVVSEQSTDIAPGTVHTSSTMTINGTLQSVNRLSVDTSEALTRLKAVSSNNEVSRSETVGYMIQEQEANGENVVAAVNGDFFSSVGVPSGLQVTDGEIITSPSSIQTMIVIEEDGSVRLEDEVTMTALLDDLQGETLSFNMVNRSRVASHANHAFLFTPRFGDSTRTPDNGGVEVVVDTGLSTYQLKGGVPIDGTVIAIDDTYDTDIQEGQLIVSATGSKADWIRTRLAVGDDVRISVSFNKGINDAWQVVSGNSTLGKVLLKDGAVPAEILDPSDPLNTARHPRTMLGTNGGGLFIVVVDGRLSGHSEGITMAEGAYYLQSLGADQAINIDGGGSSTYFARLPGDDHPRLLNRVSDGLERTIGNSLMLISDAPQGALEGLVIQPQGPIQVATNSEVPLIAKGYDTYYNPLPVDPQQVVWNLTGNIGSLSSSQVFTAASSPAGGTIEVAIGGINTELEVSVTDAIDELRLYPRDFVIESGASQTMQLRAFDVNGDPILLSNHQVTWSAPASLGTLTADGEFTAGTVPSEGWITANYGSYNVQAKVKTGLSPVIEPFESMSDIQASEVRTVPGSTTVSLVDEPNPIAGSFAAKFTYDFTGTPGTSGAYIQFLDDNGQVGRPVEGKPERLGVWVYGDGRMHHLRLGITDGLGTNRLWNFTTSNGLNWTGWRYVSLEVPEQTEFPIKIRNIALEESNANNKTAGTLYFDNFTAEYHIED